MTFHYLIFEYFDNQMVNYIFAGLLSVIQTLNNPHPTLWLLAVHHACKLNSAGKVLGLGAMRCDLGLKAGVLPQEGLAHV